MYFEQCSYQINTRWKKVKGFFTCHKTGKSETTAKKMGSDSLKKKMEKTDPGPDMMILNHVYLVDKILRL